MGNKHSATTQMGVAECLDVCICEWYYLTMNFLPSWM